VPISASPAASRPIRTASGSCARWVTGDREVSSCTKPPTRSAFARVPIPSCAPSNQAATSTATLTAMLASPKESGVCRARPWCSTSQGVRPSRDSSKATIPVAKRNSPARSQARRVGRLPLICGGARTLEPYSRPARALEQHDPALLAQVLGRPLRRVERLRHRAGGRGPARDAELEHRARRMLETRQMVESCENGQEFY
jgi:hypothetical protein